MITFRANSPLSRQARNNRFQMFRCSSSKDHASSSLSFAGPAISAKPEAAAMGQIGKMRQNPSPRFRRGLQVDPEPEKQRQEQKEEKSKGQNSLDSETRRGPDSDGRIGRGQDFIQIRVLNEGHSGAEWGYGREELHLRKSSLNLCRQHKVGLGLRASMGLLVHPFLQDRSWSLLGNLQADASQRGPKQKLAGRSLKR